MYIVFKVCSNKTRFELMFSSVKREKQITYLKISVIGHELFNVVTFT